MEAFLSGLFCVNCKPLCGRTPFSISKAQGGRAGGQMPLCSQWRTVIWVLGHAAIFLITKICSSSDNNGKVILQKVHCEHVRSKWF